MTRTTNAKFAGAAYLSYIAVGIANELLTSRAMSGGSTAARLAQIAQHSTDLRVTVILKLCECFSAFVLGVALYGITRDQNHELAMLGMLCRVSEGIFIASLIPNQLDLVWLAQQGGANRIEMAAFLMRPGSAIGAIFFAVGSALFTYLLLRGRLIPVWLSMWGLLSSIVLVISVPLQIAGLLTGSMANYLWLPAIVFAPVFALWLLTKGVRDTNRVH